MNKYRLLITTRYHHTPVRAYFATKKEAAATYEALRHLFHVLFQARISGHWVSCTPNAVKEVRS